MSIGRQTFFASHVSACHCEPVLGPPQRGTLCGERSPKEALLPRWPSAGITTGPRKAARFVGKGDPRERCPALAFGRSWAWRTLGRRGVAIRVSAGIPDKLAAARANSYQLRICLRYYSLPCAAARRTDCHVASLLAMTCRNMAGVRLGSYVVPWQSASPAQGVHCGNVLTNVATPPPSACHCEPVRTLVRQSASPQGNFASWQYLGQIRSFYVFAGNSCVLLCAAAGERIVPSLRSSQ